ncbi:MAG: LytTR family transcriptional regulator [Bacteroidales bacterium]|nr:LytTR family transcriptional regulator [Bacteroidales bacterium]
MKTRKRLITQTPECLTDPTSQVISVIISTLFALVFLTAYVPFSETAWFRVGWSKDGTGGPNYFFITLAFVGAATIFLAFSRILMNWVLRKSRHFPFWLYILWLFLEIMIIAICHTLISYFQIPGKSTEYSFAYLYAKSVLISFIAIAVPYTVTTLAIMLKDTQQRLMLTKSDMVESDDEVMPEHTEIINLMDNNGNLKLSVKLDNLYYIKAEDNYINVFFQRGGAIASYMLRCKMKTIEDNCVDSSSLMRCHRSYIVNIKKVSVLHNESDGFIIDFEREGLESIPVSKTYSQKVLEAFNKK